MRPRDTAALILVAVALAFSALAIGGAPRWAACASAALCLATAIPYVTSRRTASSPSPLLYPLAIAAGLTALQLVPLPRAIAEQLVPAKLALVTENAAAWGDAPPAWVVASYDPPATLVELAKLCGYLALGWTCVRLSAQRRARRWLATAVAGVATLVAVVTLAHRAAGTAEIYGALNPGFPSQLVGPIVNVNHLAAYLGLIVPLALALAVTARGAARAAWLGATVIVAATTLLTASRGGALSLVAGVVVVATLLVVQRRAGVAESGRRTPPSVAIPAAIVTVCAVVLLGALTAGDVAGELEATGLDELRHPHSKYQVWVASLDLLHETHWLGAGRGAFEAGFTPYGPGLRAYSHAENSYLQAALDLGLPGALALAAALVLVARAVVRRWRHGPLEAAVIAGGVALAIHDLADFAIELPAVAAAAIATLAVALPERLGTATDTTGGRAAAPPRRVVVTRIVTLAAFAGVVALAASPLGRGARADAVAVAAVPAPRDQLDAARAAWARHPADAMLAGRTAQAAFALGDPRAVAIINRALARDPRHGGLYHLAARMLARSQRPEQSAAAFAQAIRWSIELGPIVADVVRVFDTPERVAAALPSEPRQLWRVLRALRAHPDHALAYARRVAADHPRDAAVQAQLADVALSRRDAALALAASRAAWGASPTARHATLLGRALTLSGDAAGALAHLTAAVEATSGASRDDRALLLFALAEAQVAGKDPAAAKATLERALAVAEGNRHLMQHGHLRLAAVEDLLGNRNQAEWERRRAAELALD
jgi:O-antigen ligase